MYKVHWPHNMIGLPEGTYSVEFERARNFFPFSFLRLPLRFPEKKQNITHLKYKQIQLYAKDFPCKAENIMSQVVMGFFHNLEFQNSGKRQHLFLLWQRTHVMISSVLVVDKIQYSKIIKIRCSVCYLAMSCSAVDHFHRYLRCVWHLGFSHSMSGIGH